MMSASDMITVGYVSALFTLRTRRAEESSITARRLRTGANWPEASPAATMLTYSGSKTCG